MLFQRRRTQRRNLAFVAAQNTNVPPTAQVGTTFQGNTFNGVPFSTGQPPQYPAPAFSGVPQGGFAPVRSNLLFIN